MAAAQPKVLPKPVDWDELYPGRFLKAVDFKGKNVTLKISSVNIEELIGDKGPQIKGVIGFDKTEKQWALNKTNGICLKEMFGKKVQAWVGKRVTLFPSMWDGEECIRVHGSPDIAEEREITIALPRKRPFAMTMHRTAGGPAPAKTDAGGGDAIPFYTTESAVQALRGCEDLDALERVYLEIRLDFRNTKRDLPLDVEATHHDRKEALSQ